MRRPATAIGALVLAAAACGTGAVAKSDVEKNVSDQLTATVGQKPKSIACPGDLAATVGTTMRCSLTADDDTSLGLTVTVTSVQDSNVKFDIAVDRQ